MSTANGVDIENIPKVRESKYPSGALPEQPYEDDFLAGVQACDLSGEGTCESCQ